MRIHLRADGTGSYVSRFLKDAPVLSEIPRWTLNGSRVVMLTSVVDQPSDAMTLSGDVDSRRLSLRIVGRNGEWRTTAMLNREDDTLEAIAETNKRMKEPVR